MPQAKNFPPSWLDIFVCGVFGLVLAFGSIIVLKVTFFSWGISKFRVMALFVLSAIGLSLFLRSFSEAINKLPYCGFSYRDTPR